MKERPILFNGDMVLAVLGGGKTQTRRIVKRQPPEGEFAQTGLYHPTITDRNGEYQPAAEVFGAFTQDGEWALKCPYGEPGDQLWVRETWRTDDSLNDKAPSTFSSWPVKYEADGKRLAHGAFHGNTNGKTRTSIHMPRWASRIQLEITGVRIERLNEISDAESIAEGIEQLGAGWQRYHRDPDAPVGQPFTLNPKLAYRGLWESINGAGSWNANPWVWVIEFKRVTA